MNEFQDVISDEELVAKIRSTISDEQFFSITDKDIAGKSTQETIVVLQDLFAQKGDYTHQEQIIQDLFATMRQNGFDFASRKHAYLRHPFADLLGLSTTQRSRYELLLNKIMYTNMEKYDRDGFRVTRRFKVPTYKQQIKDYSDPYDPCYKDFDGVYNNQDKKNYIKFSELREYITLNGWNYDFLYIKSITNRFKIFDDYPEIRDFLRYLLTKNDDPIDRSQIVKHKRFLCSKKETEKCRPTYVSRYNSL